jgi:hypothetical protein
VVAAAVAAGLAALGVAGVVAVRHVRARQAPAAAAPAAACDANAGPCAQSVDGARLVFDLAPRPVRGLEDMTFTVRATREGAPVAGATGLLELSMPAMYMGENRVTLVEAEPGLYRGRGTVVRCPSGERAWAAAVTLQPPGGARLTATFTFDLAP